MNANERTSTDSRERSAEQAFIIMAGLILAQQAHASVARRRWRRGRTMRNPALVFLLAWTAGSAATVVNALVDHHHYRLGHDTALQLIGIAGFLWILIGAATWITWILALNLWEALVWFTHTNASLTKNVQGHWATIPECVGNKAILEQQLWQLAPDLTISALVAAAGAGGGLLGVDAATAYHIAQPWFAWNQAQLQLQAGQAVWIEHPPAPDQTLNVVGPYIRVVLTAGAIAAWIACFNDLPGNDTLTITVIAAIILVFCFRHRIRALVPKIS